MNIRERLLSCLQTLGIVTEGEENFLLSDVIDTSLLFVSMIIEVEQEFEIEISDDYLIADRLVSFEDLENMVESVLQAKEEKEI
mgnify:CR=1 FL=1